VADPRHQIAIVSALGGIAAYAGRQSGHHRAEETEARNTELRLAAIDPYLALVDPDRRDDIKGGLARRIFAPQSEGTVAVSANHDPSLSSQAIELIGEQVKAVLRAQTPPA
jgi:hypothetical protein